MHFNVVDTKHACLDHPASHFFCEVIFNYVIVVICHEVIECAIIRITMCSL